MSLSKAQRQHWPQGSTLAEKVWGPEEDLPQPTSFINTIRIDIERTILDSGNSNRKEGVERVGRISMVS